MFRLSWDDFAAIILCLEGFFYGIYSGIFVIYLQYQLSKKDTNKTQNVIMYSICTLYVLSVVLFLCDVLQLLLLDASLPLYFIQNISFGCCDFIAQFILIYRCWIVWGRNIRVVIIPSILAFAFLVIWLLSGSFASIVSNGLVIPGWAFAISVLGLALSLTVNAAVTGLVIFRIFKVFREVRAASDDQILGATGGNKLRRVIFILIESGTALFSIQLARLVIGLVGIQEVAEIIGGIHEMLTGITPTIIVVRTAMGLSFDDEKSIEEVAIGSLHFVTSHPNSVPESGNINIVDQDRRDDDDNIGIRQSNDIEVVDR